jgi:hypothetical protein
VTIARGAAALALTLLGLWASAGFFLSLWLALDGFPGRGTELSPIGDPILAMVATGTIAVGSLVTALMLVREPRN